MVEAKTLFDSDEAEYEYMKEREEKEKQVEELREFIRCMDGSTYRGGPIRVVNHNALAIAIYNEGYRRQSEVAAEIFAEIRLCWARRLFDCDDFSFKDFAFGDFAGDLDELCKKYTGVPDINDGHKNEEEAHHG